MTVTSKISCEVMHLNSTDNQPTSVLCVMGDIDITTVTELRAVINGLLTEEGAVRLIVDLSGVAHIDSSGIGALLEGLHQANQKHMHFLLCGMNQATRRMLERTRLSLVFDTCPTVVEGLQAEALH
ncbi:MAG TPA: STAS domain-containing protein [Terriglobales bacterium]|nr:STAS domain-containing protein [Terriglobales bacterium]